MKYFPAKLDATNALIAFKTCLAIILSLAIALQLDWKPSFGAILIVVLQTPMAGATYKKGLLYIAGTLGGAITGLTMVALFADDRVAFITAMALLTGFGVYRLQVSRYPYAWLIFTVTSMLVGFFSVQDPSSAFGIAVMRSSTICLSVVIAFLVHGILWPIRAGKVYERQLHGFLDGCHRLVSLTSRELAGDVTDPDVVRKAGTAQIQAIAALSGTLDAATADTDRFRRFQAGYQRLDSQLYDLLLVILAVRDGIGISPAPDNICSGLQAVETEMENLVSDLERPRDGTAVPREFDAAAGVGVDETGMLAASIRDLAQQIWRVRSTVASVEDPEQAPAPVPAPPSAPFHLTGAKMHKAAGSSLVILLLGWFFIQTQWPMGLMLSMVFASIAICLGTLIPLVMIRRQLLLSLIIGAAIAAPLYLGIMPGIDRYGQLIPWLCLALFPLLYLIAVANPKTTIQYLFSAIFVIALLSLDEESQSYSFSSFVNTWMGFCGGFAVTLMIFGLIWPVVPEHEFWKQVRAFFTACSQTMQDLVRTPPGTAAGAAMVRSNRQKWPVLFKQLQMWSSAVDYQRVPDRDLQATRALIESIEHAALRLDALEHARRHSAGTLAESQRQTLQRLHDACIESFQMIANSIGDQNPVQALPATGSLVHDLESKAEDVRLMNITAHLGSLQDAIADCRDKANAFDWKAWNRNYF